MGVLKVLIPTSEHRVQSRYDTGETFPTATPCPGTYPLSYRLQTLAPYPALPRLEAVAQEVEALARFPAIPNVGFVRIEREAVFFYPSLHEAKSRPRFIGCLTQHHKVVGVAHHLISVDHLQYCEGSDSCPRSLQGQVSPLIAPYLPIVPSPTTQCAPLPLSATTAYRAASGLRHRIAGSPQHNAEFGAITGARFQLTLE